MDSARFEILTVHPAPKDASYLGRVNFAFRPSEFEPLKITRRVETSNDKWQTYTDAEIDGARIVRVRSAFVRRSKKGELYVQTSGVDIPWDISRTVADEAFSRLEAGARES